MTYPAFENGHRWSLDECDIAGIQEKLHSITDYWLQKEDPDMDHVSFLFREIEGLAAHAAECIENGGPEPGETEIEEND